MSSGPTLADLPAAARRPVQWRRLFDALAALRGGDPARAVDGAYTVQDAIGGASDERMLARLLSTPEGRALASERSSLPAVLADRAALRRLPEGSFGRVYASFCDRNGIDPHALVDASHRMSRDYERLDPVRRWWSDRLTVIHDLAHVLAGYETSIAGEAALMGFFLAQRVNDRAVPIFVPMSIASGQIDGRTAWQAIHRGLRADWISLQPFETLLGEPLSAVRARLRIDDPRLAHPRSAKPDLLIGEDPPR
ncbi:MAG: Coq4 family protein [Myxococcota bacterium]